MRKPQQIGNAHNYPSSRKRYSASCPVIGGRKKEALYAQRHYYSEFQCAPTQQFQILGCVEELFLMILRLFGSPSCRSYFCSEFYCDIFRRPFLLTYSRRTTGLKWVTFKWRLGSMRLKHVAYVLPSHRDRLFALKMFMKLIILRLVC